MRIDHGEARERGAPSSAARSRTAHLIWNPVSGGRDSDADLARLRGELEPDLTLVVHETTPDADARTMTRRALAQGAEIVLSAGGDGTVSAVSGELMGTGVHLGVVPRGTANAFASCVLGLATHVDPIGVAASAIRGGDVRRVDGARANGRPMVQLVGLGLEAGMIAAADREQKDAWGVLAYLAGAVGQLREQQPFAVTLEVDGVQRRFTALAVVVANAAPKSSLLAQGGGTPRFDDGLLDVTVVVGGAGAADTIAALGELAGAAFGETEGGERIAHFLARRVRVDADPPQRLAIDGELVGTTPLEVECLPGALEVFVPPASDALQPEAPDPQLRVPPSWSLVAPYLGLATVFAALAAVIGGVGWVLVWPAASFLLVSSGYLWLGPGVLGKRQDGTRPWLLRWVSWPFRALASFRSHVRRATAEPAYDRVTPTLYFGRRPRRGELPDDVELVIDVTAELDRVAASHVTYRCLPTLDFERPDEGAFRRVLAETPRDRVVYVYCAAGHGRSAMVTAALLVHRGEAKNIDAAYEALARVRPQVRKNRWQARLARRVVGERPADG